MSNMTVQDVARWTEAIPGRQGDQAATRVTAAAGSAERTQPRQAPFTPPMSMQTPVAAHRCFTVMVYLPVPWLRS